MQSSIMGDNCGCNTNDFAVALCRSIDIACGEQRSTQLATSPMIFLLFLFRLLQFKSNEE